MLSVHLPGVRVRVFVKGKDARFREVPMSLDTLFADLDQGKLYLTWRGLDAVGGRRAQAHHREQPARAFATDLVGGGIDSDPR